jgi:acyl-CoA reductase-like NAD-dependent aldehyde dehydrogenase
LPRPTNPIRLGRAPGIAAGPEGAAVTSGRPGLHGTAKAALRADEFDRVARIEVLEAAVRELKARHELFARTIAVECAKPIMTARVEASRTMDTFAFAAAEARTYTGDMVPVDAVASGRGKIAYTLRVPVGVVAAIAPFTPMAVSKNPAIPARDPVTRCLR